MTDFILHTAATAPKGSRAALAAVAKTWGFIPNLHAILAESPAALIGYDTLFGLVGSSTLSPVEQQVVFQAVNVFHGCEYCTMGHTYLARAAGMDEASVQALRGGMAPSEPRLAALFGFTRAILEARGDAGETAVANFIAAGFTRANLLEVVTAIATKTLSNYATHLTRTPNEAFMSDPAVAWTVADRAAAAE